MPITLHHPGTFDCIWNGSVEAEFWKTSPAGYTLCYMWRGREWANLTRSMLGMSFHLMVSHSLRLSDYLSCVTRSLRYPWGHRYLLHSTVHLYMKTKPCSRHSLAPASVLLVLRSDKHPAQKRRQVHAPPLLLCGNMRTYSYPIKKTCRFYYRYGEQRKEVTQWQLQTWVKSE